MAGTRILVLAVLPLLAACSTLTGAAEQTLSFAQMQSLNPGVSGTWILSEYPFASEMTRRPDGTLERLGYWVSDPHGDARPLVLYFDGRGILVRKQYGGPLLRPPQKSEGDLDIGFG